MAPLAKNLDKVERSYDALAEEYAKRISRELDHRPRERELLQRVAARCRDQGMIWDRGCGPGHVARYIQEFSPSVIGLDLSLQSVIEARQRNPEIPFVQGDMLALPFASGRLGGIVAFYSMIHFDGPQVEQSFAEMWRALRTRAHFLLGVHVGSETVHLDGEVRVGIHLDGTFFTMDGVTRRLPLARLTITEQIQRP